MLRATMLAQSWKPRTQKKACSEVYLEKKKEKKKEKSGVERRGEMRRDAERWKGYEGASY